MRRLAALLLACGIIALGLSALGPGTSTSASGLTTVWLQDGSSVRGERIHTYDQSIWWHPTQEQTHAIFRPDGRQAKVHFLSTPEVVTVDPPAGPPREGYRQALRRLGIALDTLPLAGISFVITGNDGHHKVEDGYGDFAWDLVRTDAQGRHFTGSGTANDDYLVWDDAVFLPTTGRVVEVVGHAPDNTPGSIPPQAENNLVGVHLHGDFYLYLLHFRKGSIPAYVQPGAVLPAGTYLGRVGNSGVSLEPHLHMTMLYWDTDARPPRFWSVPAEFREVHMRTLGQPSSIGFDYLNPSTGTWLAKTPF